MVERRERRGGREESRRRGEMQRGTRGMREEGRKGREGRGTKEERKGKKEGGPREKKDPRWTQGAEAPRTQGAAPGAAEAASVPRHRRAHQLYESLLITRPA